jgi:hypothetical protein
MNVRKNQKRRNRFENLVSNLFETVSNPQLDRITKYIIAENQGKGQSFEPLREGQRVRLIRTKETGHISVVGINEVAVILDNDMTKIVGRYEVSRL